MAPFEDVLARNVSALRSRARLNMELVAARMRALGYKAWLRQTVANVEKGKRRLTGGEIQALAWVLGTSVSALIMPSDDDVVVEFPAGSAIAVASVRRSIEGRNDGAVRWDGDVPVFDTEPALTQLNAEGLVSRVHRNSAGVVTRQDPETGEWTEDGES